MTLLLLSFFCLYTKRLDVISCHVVMKNKRAINGLYETLEEHDLSEFLENKYTTKQEESFESLNLPGCSSSSLLPKGWQYRRRAPL